MKAHKGELQNSLALLLVAKIKEAPTTSESRPPHSASQHPRHDRFKYRDKREKIAATTSMSV